MINSGKTWTKTDETKLRNFAKQGLDTDLIGTFLGRSPTAIRSKASELGISLKPKDKSE